MIQITINALPVPDSSVPWEQLVDFRDDPDTKTKFLTLRNWINETARAELSPLEIEQKIEYLLEEYRRHMEIHKMKMNVGTLETFANTAAEVTGDLISFKWGAASKVLFELKRRRVSLMEKELNAPGKEVAFLLKAKESFGS